MSTKVSLVGAGSRDFGRAMIRDLLLSDPLTEGGLILSLMDRDATALERNHAYAERVAAVLGRRPELQASTDLETVLAGCDAVLVSIETDRYRYWAQDFHVPRKLGFPQIYGENGGPGGLFHALRNMGPFLDIVRAVERTCPEAWVLNFTNPLAKLCEAASRLTPVRVIGLCHGVLAGRRQLARLLEMPVGDLDTAASGVNHFTWFTRIRHRVTGEDLYPRLREREREAHWLAEWDDIALSRILFRVFGLYPSPGANHIGEYVRWAEGFLASDKLQFFHDPREGRPWEAREGARRATWFYNLHDHPTDTPLFPETDPDPHGVARRGQDEAELTSDGLRPSGEVAVPIIEGLRHGIERHFHAVNVPNAGTVPGLDEGAVVEVPGRVGTDGLTVEPQPRLPEGALALLRTQTSINRLLVDAFEAGSRDLLLQALLIDPVTHSYGAAVEVIDELCRLQAEVLPPLEWRERRNPSLP